MEDNSDYNDPFENLEEPETPGELLNREGQRPCPVCGALMSLRADEGVVVDYCEEHGIWLDKGELRKIRLSLRRKGNTRRRQAMQRARQEGKLDGIFRGWGSLFFK